MRTCYYYQTFIGLEEVLQSSENVDEIIISSIHFDTNKQNQIQIYLNDNIPDSKQFDTLWTQTKACQEKNIDVLVMMGGAGLAFQVFFKHMSEAYPQLLNFLKKRPWIKGIDLDVEEYVNVSNIKKLIDSIKQDMGSDFRITMAPLGSSLSTDNPGMGSFSYKQLYNSPQGKQIDVFHAQCYGGSFSKQMYESMVKNGYPPEKICMGMMSGDFDSHTYENAVTVSKEIREIYPTMNGVFVWEYIDSPPDRQHPIEWANGFKQNVNYCSLS